MRLRANMGVPMCEAIPAGQCGRTFYSISRCACVRCTFGFWVLSSIRLWSAHMQLRSEKSAWRHLTGKTCARERHLRANLRTWPINSRIQIAGVVVAITACVYVRKYSYAESHVCGHRHQHRHRHPPTRWHAPTNINTHKHTNASSRDGLNMRWWWWHVNLIRNDLLRAGARTQTHPKRMWLSVCTCRWMTSSNICAMLKCYIVVCYMYIYENVQYELYVSMLFFCWFGIDDEVFLVMIVVL